MKSTRDVLRDAIASEPGITEKQLGERTGFSTSKLTPSRIRLWEAGEIEPTTEAGWTAALVSRIKDVGWQVVEVHRQAEVAARAGRREKRNAKSVEQRARRAAEDLADPVVFRLFQELTKRDPANTRASQRRRERTVRQRETLRKQEAKRAERERTANADFKKKLALLWDARSTVAAIDQHLIDERARVAEGSDRKIGDRDWVTALRDVVMILQSLGSIWWNVRDLGADLPCPVCGAHQAQEERHLPPFVLEVEVEDEEVVDAEVVND
ncbi:MAG TPA: hypothetical protein VGI17_03595 [Solirubrobacterales bacterium]